MCCKGKNNYLYLQCFVRWNFLQELSLHLRVVNVAAVVGETVAYYYIRYAQYIIICHGLLEGLAVDANAWGFVLNYGQRLQVAVVDHGVAAARHAVEVDGHLIGHKRGRVILLAYEKMHKVLAHPLLGRQCDITLAQSIENYVFFAFFFDICLEGGQI